MTVKAVAATGQLGTGFHDESLDAAVAGGAHFIGCDAGSSDPGPYYLGSGTAKSSREAVLRDTKSMLAAAVKADIPVVIGSAGTAGGAPHLEWMTEIVREIAAEQGWHLRLATIASELAKDELARRYAAKQISPLNPAPPFDEQVIHGAERFVAMMGIEPIQRALDMGAQVILAGRCSDVSIYAALPVMRGIPKGVAFHAGKILECGAASVTHRIHPDCMAALLDGEGFTVEPPNPQMRCTPESVVAHTLYENADPYRLLEPGGLLDTEHALYTAASDRAVRVQGSRFVEADNYTVRLEGAALAGYRAVSFAGIRDPLVLRQLDNFLAELRSVVERKVESSLNLTQDSYTLTWRVYGRNGAMGEFEPDPQLRGNEVGLLMDVIAPTQAGASAIIAITWHTGLHHPIPEYEGLISNFAFPFSPPGIPAGPAYRFCANHVLKLDEPCEVFPITIEEL